jgi:hypothetical protein
MYQVLGFFSELLLMVPILIKSIIVIPGSSHSLDVEIHFLKKIKSVF